MARKYPSGKSEGIEHKKIEAGTLGKFLGMGDYALKNVIGIIAIILTVIMLALVIALPFSNNSDNILKTLTIIAPLFTLVIGYLAGAIRK